MKKVYSYKAPKYQGGGLAPADPFPQGGSNEEIKAWYTRNPPQGGTISEAREDSFMDKAHAFAQNPFTVAKSLYQNNGEWTDGIGPAIDAGTVSREAYDMPIDLINLPGAVSKMSQGVAKGDVGKAAYGALQAIPYAGTIGKGVQGAMKGVSPYLDDAANAIAQVGDDAMHAYKNVAGKAMPMLDKTTAKYTAKLGVKHAPGYVSNIGVSPTDLMPTAYAAQPTPNYQAGGMVNVSTGLLPGVAKLGTKIMKGLTTMDAEDFLIPQSVQNMVPLNVRAFANDLMGNDSEINERHLSQAEKDALQSAREKAEKQVRIL